MLLIHSAYLVRLFSVSKTKSRWRITWTSDQHCRNETNNISLRHWQRYWSRFRWMKSHRSNRRGNLPHHRTIGRFQTGARCSSEEYRSYVHWHTAYRCQYCMEIPATTTGTLSDERTCANTAVVLNIPSLARRTCIASSSPFFTSSPYRTHCHLPAPAKLCVRWAPNWLPMKCVCVKSTTHRLRRLKRPYAEHCSRDDIQLEQRRLTVSTCFLIKLGQNGILSSSLYQCVSAF